MSSVTVDDNLTMLATALSYDDIIALRKSPRLGKVFNFDAFLAMYIPSTSVPSQLMKPLEEHCMVPHGKTYWRGSLDTGRFTLETPDRSYLLHGHVVGGELAGNITVISRDNLLQGTYDNGRQSGTWIIKNDIESTTISQETYVGGLRQGTSYYYYDVMQQPKKQTVLPTKMYEVDYVNDKPDTWRLFRTDGSLDATGYFS